MIGRTVSRYRITGKLGEGGMATVWKAEDPLLGRTVALKLLGPELRSSADGRRRFLREARAASVLNHPGICGVHDAGEADGEVFIALPFVDGRTVSAMAERSPLAIADVVRVGISVGEALGHAHAHGVVHRDVTGRNIMMARDGRVLVLDFGLALAVGASRLTTSGAHLGTVAYLSPEVASGGRADLRSDLYGLGVVLYEALTGTLPFAHERAEALLYSIVHESPEPPGRRRRDTPPGLEAVVTRLLAKKPADRYQSAAELVEALRGLALAHGAPEAAPRWVDEPSGPGTPEPQRYVAVLPFEVAGEVDEDRDRTMLIRGLAEVVATALSRVPNLHVVPPALAASQDLTGDHQLTARQLGAQLLLRTTVRRAGSRLRVTWGLLDAPRGVQVAGETLEGLAADAFGLEDRLVASVLRAMGFEAPPGPPRRPPDPAARERYMQAIGYLQRHEDEASVDAAVRILEGLRASEGESASYDAALGRAYLYKRRITHDARWEGLAAAACERAMAADPGAPDAMVTLGDLAAATGQIARAIASFEGALAADPDRPEALIGLGRVLIAAGRLGDAERTLRRSVELRPGFWDAHNALGRFLMRVGRYDEALAEFECVLRLTPDNTLGLLNLTGALFELERFEEAEEACRRSIEIRPTPSALSNLGSILFYVGRYQESAVAFERAVNLQPADAMLWGNLGSSCRYIPGYEHRTREALERAVALGRGRLERNPTDARDWTRLGSWLSNLERHAEARAAIERALALEPANPEFMAFACGIYHQAGDRELALRWLREALSHGFRPAQLERDPHLARLREDPEFGRIVAEAMQLRSAH